ncbi:hypothetical protein F3J38_27730 [Pantoea sp. Acro-805]|uniref:Uncharacterized protein n=1 Tax=Candidatus Pantoea formicae TaxID=2608355 RepID=A0ABX0R9P7_9GAMM|nr:hypothetical protein [Pantoea formicae]NIF03787.1 hypothetical protein [Pantoea formicae]
MMAEWRDFVTLPGLLLMAGLAAVNLYLWVSLGAEVRRWRRRRSRMALPRLQVQFLPPERSPLPLLLTTLVTGLASVWMLAVLLPVV